MSYKLKVINYAKQCGNGAAERRDTTSATSAVVTIKILRIFHHHALAFLETEKNIGIIIPLRPSLVIIMGYYVYY